MSPHARTPSKVRSKKRRLWLGLSECCKHLLGPLRCCHSFTVALRCQGIKCKARILALRCTIHIMSSNDHISEVMSEMGRRGGLARAKALTAKQRRESAIKASKAAAK